MGWLYMRSLDGHSGPRQYLDAQFTYERPNVTSKVIKSALIRMRVYYAAVEHIYKDIGQRDVWGLVCLVHYNPRDREGYIFGYKDMEESMGPCECECPSSILDLLTPTDNEYAQEWRARCRARADKSPPRAGQTIVFEQPVSFSDGKTFQRLDVVPNPRWRGRVLFRDPDSGGLYRITNIKDKDYRIQTPGGA
ncbi:MAG: hypothetical protein WBO09_01670 [Methylocystis silviterrae]|uniref:DUF6927 domain-containing protein n=1 Tax=Methylocystis silviterrae TaxID=2743612 RepID=UPI003C725641